MRPVSQTRAPARIGGESGGAALSDQATARIGGQRDHKIGSRWLCRQDWRWRVDSPTCRSSSGVERGLFSIQGRPVRCSQPSDTSNRGPTMSTLLLTIQIACYAFGLVSAALNIASFVRGWRAAEAPFEGDEPGDWP